MLNQYKMPKRFTDTDKWKKPFIRGLDGPYKLFWLYLLDDCDHAGIWQVDFPVAEIRTGEKLNQKKAIESLGSRIEVFDNGSKWFVKDFIFFQYGELSEKNRMHLSVINILRKHEIGAYKPLERGQGTIQGQGQDKGQGLLKKSASEIFKEFMSDPIFMEDLNRAHPGKDFSKAWAECYLHHSASPHELQEWEWRRKLNTWLTIKGDTTKAKEPKKLNKLR